MPSWFLMPQLNTFVPTDVSGCKLWLDANQIAGLSDGDAVATWEDTSGNNFDATEPTNRPTYKTNIKNGKPIVRFDGSNDKLKVTPGGTGISEVVTTTAKTIWVVFSPISVGANSNNASPAVYDNRAVFASWNTITGNGGSINCAVKSNSGSPLLQYQQYPDTVERSVATGTWYIAQIRHDSGTTYMRVNGGTDATVSDAASGTDTGFVFGSNYDYTKFLEVDIAEVLMYNVVVGSSDRTLIENYLNDKWDIY